MVSINLLPHREQKRIRRRRDFYLLSGLSLLAAALVVFAVSVIINGYVSRQVQRNNFISAENAKLDTQIKEIANLKQEIDALKARQEAVEDLQGDRNLPVHLLDELVKQVPEGIYLQAIKQDNMRVTLTGLAQSNERVSELLRNLGTNSNWLGSPELVEIKSAVNARDNRHLNQFTINLVTRRPREGGELPEQMRGAPPGRQRVAAATLPARSGQ